MVTVWTNENCVQCDRTKKFLDDNNIPYEAKAFADHQEDLKRFIDAGFKSAPIVETPHDTWAGFKLDKLKGLVVGENQ